MYERSMSPLFEPGDRLLVDPRAFRDRRPEKGDVVVARDPTSPGRLLLKRVGANDRLTEPGGADTTKAPAGSVWLVSDHSEGAIDSRRFGPVPEGDLIGRVWARRRPPGPTEILD